MQVEAYYRRQALEHYLASDGAVATPPLPESRALFALGLLGLFATLTAAACVYAALPTKRDVQIDCDRTPPLLDAQPGRFAGAQLDDKARPVLLFDLGAAGDNAMQHPAELERTLADICAGRRDTVNATVVQAAPPYSLAWSRR